MNERAIEQAWNGPAQCEHCGVRHLVLFSALEKDEFTLIHDPINEMEFAKGRRLYRENDFPDYLYTVREGSVKLVNYLPDGSERIVRLLSKGDVAGLETLLAQPYHHDAVVIAPVLTCRIPVRSINYLSRELPHFHYELLTRWQKAVNDADAWLTELGTGSARARVARLLLRLASVESDHECFIPTREDIGSMIGVSTETVSRITADFDREGLMENTMSQRVRIDPDALRALSEET